MIYAAQLNWDALKIRVMVALFVSWSFVIANLVKTGLKLHKHSHMRLLLHLYFTRLEIHLCIPKIKKYFLTFHKCLNVEIAAENPIHFITLVIAYSSRVK